MLLIERKREPNFNSEEEEEERRERVIKRNLENAAYTLQSVDFKIC